MNHPTKVTLCPKCGDKELGKGTHNRRLCKKAG